MENCLFCRRTNSISIVEQDSISKLQNLIPECDWESSFKICRSCEGRLNSANEFKILCSNSYKILKQISNEHEAFHLPTDKFDLHSNGIIFELQSCNIQHQADLSEGKDYVNIPVQEQNCEFCGEVFRKQISLETHFDTCCKRQSESKRKEQDRELEDILSLTCELCGSSFGNKYLLKRHIKNVHASEKKFKCEICSSAFASSVYLNAHKRYHIGERTHMCSFCGKGFITASDLYHHEKIHANKRSYRCEECPKGFNTSSDLHKHKICVHLDRSKWKYICLYCDKRFPLKTNLDSHLKIHTGEKNFVCHLCDRKCINKSVLTRHIGTHSNIVAFKCHICLQGYKYKRSLNLHMIKLHGFGDSKTVERIKKFVCPHCKKSFLDNNKLQKHLKSHRQDSPQSVFGNSAI